MSTFSLLSQNPNIVFYRSQEKGLTIFPQNPNDGTYNFLYKRMTYLPASTGPETPFSTFLWCWYVVVAASDVFFY